LKHGLKNAPFTCEQTVSPFANSVPAGMRMKRTGPEPWMRSMPATEPSPKMRPVPTVPSKQVKLNCLPATNRRAASAPNGSASAGTANATADNATARRTTMPV